MSEDRDPALSLAAEFPGASAEDWRARVAAVLKGAPFAKLVGKTADGIEIQPLYARHKPRLITGARPATRWRIFQRIDLPDGETAAGQALQDLEGGADGLVLTLAGSPLARGFGLPLSDAAALDAALAGVMPELIALRIETAPFEGRRIAALIDEIVARRRLNAADLSIDFGLDPIGDRARTGAFPVPWATICRNFTGETRRLREAGHGGSQVRVDGRVWHEAGASEAQELAGMLATGVTYLRALEDAGFALDEARRCLSFLITVDADQFLSIAKLRAMRLLWARIEQASGLAPLPITLNAETAWRMLTRRDPWVNLLRTTTAGFAAAVGGADSLTVLPFTAALGLPDAFARRLARNTQTLLQEEASLWRVADPAAGAGGYETLTDELCQTTWSIFQAIEQEGGIVASLDSGNFPAQLARSRAALRAAVASKRRPLTGTSEFPDLAELPVEVLCPAPVPASAAGLPAIRLSEPYEALRDASDAWLARKGERPLAFLATLGGVADFTARATFARNFLEAGGIAAPIGDGFGSIAAMTEAFRHSGAKVACLCGTDADYATRGAEAIAALTAAGAHVILAGRPGEAEASLAAAGLKDAIFVGCDALEALGRLHRVLGLAEATA